jgi:hypothetical protein
MSQITNHRPIVPAGLLLAGLIIAIAGCSDPNPRSIINPDTGTHVAGWSNPALHGATAKAAPGSSGFSSCQSCHGDNFAGGVVNVSCLNTAGCHGVGVNAPHSPAPWRGGARTHTTTDTGNAVVCALCHQSNPGVPGCFNNTLCHAVPGHPAGWADPATHGAAAKGAPSATTGFSSCQPCHGNTFAGGIGPTCLNTLGCHGVGVDAPHSPAPWRGGTQTHTNTNTGNAAVCALCHQSNPGTPGCFNNTLCHGQE